MNFHDNRIFFFEKLRFRLEKLINDSEFTTKNSSSHFHTKELPLKFENSEKG